MKRLRFSQEQITGFLKSNQAGFSAKERCRWHGFNQATFYERKSKHCGLEVSDAKRINAL